MLSDKEKTECRRILSFLADENLLDLVCTSTKDLVGTKSKYVVTNTSVPPLTLEGKGAAVNIILRHCESPMELLNRRRVTKVALLKYYYCNEAKIPVFLNDMSSKESLVNAIIEYWKPKRTHKKPRITPPSGQELQANSTSSRQSPQNYNQSASNNHQTPSHSQPATIGSIQHDFQSPTIIQQCRSRIHKLKQELTDVKETRFEEKEEYEKRIHKLKQSLTDVKETRFGEKKEHEKKLLELKKELEDVNGEKEKYENGISMCELNLAEFKTIRLKEKTEHENEIHKLKQELKHVKETRLEEKEKYEKRIRRLEQEHTGAKERSLKEKEEYEKRIRRLEQEHTGAKERSLKEKEEYEKKTEARDTYIIELLLELDAAKKQAATGQAKNLQRDSL